MKIDYEKQQVISKYAPQLEGVFTLADLRTALGIKNRVIFYRSLKLLQKAGVLSRFSRELYVTPVHNLDVVCQKLCSDSYISFGQILAKSLIIGTQPHNYIMAVKIGKKREYKNAQETVEQLGITKRLYFGFHKKNGVQYATPEKAFLDTLYFHQKGYKFYFDIYSDIRLDKLDKKVILQYLKRYRNPKFNKFVLEYLARV